MADNLKKVGLVYTAEGTVDFTKSVTQVTQVTQQNRAEFKLAQSQYDKNTSSITKLRDSQKYLASQTEVYGNKLDVLNQQLAELEGAENKDEKAIAKKKTQIAQTQTTLNNYKKGLNDVNVQLESGQAQTEEYAKKVSAMGDKMTSAGTALTKGLTAPIIALGAAAVASWNEFDNAMDNIVIATGATGDSLAGLEDVYNNIYGSFAFDSEQVATAIGDVSTRFKVAGDECQDLSTFFLQFSAITGQDVSSAVKNAQGIMQQYRLTTEDTKSVMDQMAKVSQDTGISVDTLGNNLVNNAATFKEWGIPINEAINLMGQFEDAGIDTDSMMTGLKKAATNFASQGLSMDEGLKGLVSRLNDATTEQEAYNEVTDLFGSKAALSFKNAAQSGALDLDNLTSSVDEYGNTVKNTYENIQDPPDDMTIVFHNLKEVLSELGTTIMETIAPAMKGLVDAMQDFSSWFKSVPTAVQQVIVVLGTLLAAIGPILVIVGTLAGPISTAIGLFGSLQAAIFSAGGAGAFFTGILGAISAPVVAVVAAIGLLVAAVVDLWNTNEGFRQNVEEILNNLGILVQSVYDNFISPVITFITDALTSLWENALQPLWVGFEEVVAKVVELINVFMGIVTPIIDQILNILGPIFQTALQYWSIIFDTAFKLVGGYFTTFFNTVSTIIDSIIGVIEGITTFVSGVFAGNWSQAWSGIVGAFDSIFNGIVAIAKAPINMVIGFINGMITAVQDGVNWCIDCINTLSFDVPDWVPGIGGDHWGFDFDHVTLGQIPLLAKGGELLSGMAMVAEAGPELLIQNGNSSTVLPLTNGGGATPTQIIDYEMLYEVFASAIQNMQLKVDKRILGQVVNEVSK